MSHRCPVSLSSTDTQSLPKLFRDAEHRVRQKILDLERVEPSVKNDEQLERSDEVTGIEIVFNGRRQRDNHRIIQTAFVQMDGVLIKRTPKDGSFFG